jgi:hypothetical protein
VMSTALPRQNPRQIVSCTLLAPTALEARRSDHNPDAIPSSSCGFV